MLFGMVLGRCLAGEPEKPRQWVKLPDTLHILGSDYRYDEKTLRDNWGGQLDTLKEAQEKLRAKDLSADDRDYATHVQTVSQRVVAYCVIAAAQYAKPSPEITVLLDRTLAQLGPEVAVPKDITQPDAQFLNIATVSFRKANGEGFPGNPYEEDSCCFSDLVFVARQQIEERSGKK